MRDLARRAVRGSIWVASASYSGFLLTFLSTALLARLLQPRAFGVYALAQSYSQILLALGAFGFTQAVVQSTDRDTRLADTALIMTVVVRIILCMLSIPLALVMYHYHSPDVALAFFQLSILQIADAVRTGLTITLERDLEYGRIARIFLFSNVVSAVSSVAAALGGLGAYALVVRDAALSVSLLVTSWIIAKRSKLPLGHEFHPELAKRIWAFGKSVYIVRAMDQIAGRIDRVLLGNILSLDVLGFYHQAKYLASLPANALAPGNFQVAITTYSKLKDDRPRLSRAFQTVQYFVMRLVPPFSIICALWPRDLLVLVCGPKWVEAEGPLRVLALFSLTFAAAEGYRSLFTALEGWSTLRKSAIVQAICMAVAVPVLGKAFGIVGAAAATLVASLTSVTFLRFQSKRYLIRDRPAIRGFMVVLGTFLGALGCKLLMPAWTTPIRALALGAGATLLVYAAMLMLLEREEVWERCRAVMSSALSRA